MPSASLKLCKFCNHNSIPKTAGPNTRYCSAKCRELARKQREKANGERSRLKRADERKALGIVDKEAARVSAESIQMMRRLVLDEGQDVVREVMRDEVRKQITQHIQDNVKGAAEVMTAALPRAVAACIADMERREWNVRSRAYALMMKYGFDILKQTAVDDKKDLGTMTVVHSIPMPDTNFGNRVREGLEGEIIGEAEEIAHPGDDWPTCQSCKETKPHETGSGNPWVCHACQARQTFNRNSKSQGTEFQSNQDFTGLPTLFADR